jgi:VanZ family protein
MLKLNYNPSKLNFFLAAFAWLLIIGNFSREQFSARKTNSAIEPFLHKIFPSIELGTVFFINIVMRKLAHFTEFGIFALLVFGIWAARESLWKIRWLVYSASITFIFALLDEYHQSFTRTRNPSLGDSLTDLSGGLVLLLLVLLIKKNKFFPNLPPKTTDTLPN